jgi:hypothetical protein
VRCPNDRWHIDGYDKLKPFGFCIHGAIDGYSRRILWLEVSSSNNDPTTVAKYYVDYARHVSGTARVVRGDKGTETLRQYNVILDLYKTTPSREITVLCMGNQHRINA